MNVCIELITLTITNNGLLLHMSQQMYACSQNNSSLEFTTYDIALDLAQVPGDKQT